MVKAADLQQLSHSLWLWQAFDPAVKSDLFSSAARSAEQLFLIDPIPLETPALEELDAQGQVAGILITNVNHRRAVGMFARKYDVAIFSAAEVAREFSGLRTVALNAGEQVTREFGAIPIPGAAAGETAFHFPADGGTIVVGDALINLEPYGFALLPAKYCCDQKAMRRSLRELLDWPFERLLFAHGTPLVGSARARLETLLGRGSTE